MSTLKLYNYFRSSASYRVRIALHYKEIDFEYVPVHLVKNGGEQRSENYRKLNPMAHVPTLVHGDFALAESMAIVTYLDQVFLKNPLFPSDAKLRGRTMQICEIVNSGIQPLQNLKITQDFDKNGWTPEQRDKWVQKWLLAGLASLEDVVSKSAGRFAVGDQVTAADAFIIPQMFSSRRFKIDTNAYPTLARIEKAALELPAFKKSHPEVQPDSEK